MKSDHSTEMMFMPEFCRRAGGISVGHGYRMFRKYKDRLPPALRLPGGRKIFFRRVDVEYWLADLAKSTATRRRRGRPTKASQRLRAELKGGTEGG